MCLNNQTIVPRIVVVFVTRLASRVPVMISSQLSLWRVQIYLKSNKLDHSDISYTLGTINEKFLVAVRRD